MPETTPRRHSQTPPVMLVILDGWGHREEVANNAVAQASTPNWDKLVRDYPNGLVNASELDVGLPQGQMGNSEVGHMNIGSGRVVMQDLPRIDAAIANGTLATHPDLEALIAAQKASGKPVHLMGLFSPGGVHSHQAHIIALAQILSDAGVNVWLHPFLDGRDTPPQSALGYLATLEAALQKAPLAKIGTVSGRYYAMDRDKRWDRVQLAYDALTAANAPQVENAAAAVHAAYAENITDEFIKPVILPGYPGMQDGDAVLMANFRADRARQMLSALLDPAFDAFPRAVQPQFAQAIGMVEYSDKLNPFLTTLFLPESLGQTLGEIVANEGRTQLRIAETEKYAHVTFFFNGGVETPFAGEERILIPSPNVATYDLKPEMSAAEVTDAIVDAIGRDAFDLIIVNYANTDMVGHSGDLAATAKAVEAVDVCLGRLLAALEAKNGTMLITADHGNAECMLDEENHQPHTQHTLNLVPAVIAGPQWKGRNWTLPEGRLADIAPTILQLLGIRQPVAMTGQSLLRNAVTGAAANA
jgi:2,3-bisphosphoglycerate-independent phosphoglycerate mutase